MKQPGDLVAPDAHAEREAALALRLVRKAVPLVPHPAAALAARVELGEALSLQHQFGPYTSEGARCAKQRGQTGLSDSSGSSRPHSHDQHLIDLLSLWTRPHSQTASPFHSCVP